MYQINVRNCNNIKEGSIQIKENKLNIKYGINGTGKSTITKAIEYHKDVEKLKVLNSFLSNDDASITINQNIDKVLVFNEDFVNQIVFKDDEVIGDSFEIFLKTPNYEDKKRKIDIHLNELKNIVKLQENVITLKNSLQQLVGKFTRKQDGSLKSTPTLKSLLSKENLYNIPESLKDYKLFIEDSKNNISWIDWKNKGDIYDKHDRCPFCSEKLNVVTHKNKSKIFKETYKKADSQNLQDILNLFDLIKDYMQPSEYKKLVGYVKSNTPNDILTKIVNELINEAELVYNRLCAINDFGDKKIAIADIDKLDTQIENMQFPIDLFSLFGGELFISILEQINNCILTLKDEITTIKRELGSLKGVILATVNKSQNDINTFLKTAGINYEIEIRTEDEGNSKTILKQCFSKENNEVKSIRQHLSWGEKNAFSLVLFMYYANSIKPDLIILDDPISSFDSNKKYAILHRMFKNFGRSDITLAEKTVLLLTHDFEPITDFVMIGKLPEKKVEASFIWNKEGILSEKLIDPNNDIKLLSTQCINIVKNSSVNIVSRITFLRKLSELNDKANCWQNVYEILSCLIHGSVIQRKIGNGQFAAIQQQDIDLAIIEIKKYITDFDYDEIKNILTNLNKLIEIYEMEENSYYRVQIFRQMSELPDTRNIIKLSDPDDGWFKFIDETYHIENDYLHYLDFNKFDIVPDYISKKLDETITCLKQQ